MTPTRGSYTWKPWPKSKPTTLGFFEPTLVNDKSVARINSKQLGGGIMNEYIVVVCILGNKVPQEELTDLISWN